MGQGPLTYCLCDLRSPFLPVPLDKRDSNADCENTKDVLVYNVPDLAQTQDTALIFGGGGGGVTETHIPNTYLYTSQIELTNC